MTQTRTAADSPPSSPSRHPHTSFEWRNVSYEIGVGQKAKEIVKPCSGKISGGEFCALMGPSGAGKTSLLNVLAQRLRTKGKTRRAGGEILLDGLPIDRTELRERIAYVVQEDRLFPTQTVREALLFSALLRLPLSMPVKEKRQRVEDMLADLGLLACADTICGDDRLRGISGGEKKRTAIGIELIMCPKLLFLDEPTSGLDSYAAFSVVSKLRDLAVKEGCNILTTIHQPSSAVFHSFKSTILMAKGECLYYGGIDELGAGLSALGRPCPASHNLADHALYLLQTESDEKLQKMKLALAGAAGSAAARAAGDDIAVDDVTVNAAAGTATVTTAPTKPAASADKPARGVFAFRLNRKGGKAARARGSTVEARAGFWQQLVELSRREAHAVARNRPALIASVLVPTILNLLFSCIFLYVGDATRADYGVMSHFGAITQVMISGMFGASQPLLLKFPLERGIFMREYGTSTYGTAAYFLSKSMVELPRSLLSSVIVYLVCYWLMALNGSWLTLVLSHWVTGLAAASTALFIGCIAANPDAALQAGPAIFVPQLLFAGFFISTDQMPDWLSWIQYICPLKYGLNVQILTEFDRNNTGWSDEQAEQATSIITTNGIVPSSWWIYWLVLIALVVVFRLMSVVALARRATV